MKRYSFGDSKNVEFTHLRWCKNNLTVIQKTYVLKWSLLSVCLVEGKKHRISS